MDVPSAGKGLSPIEGGPSFSVRSLESETQVRRVERLRGATWGFAPRLRAEREAWSMLWIRVAFLLGGAVSLLWAPIQNAAKIPPFRAYDAVSDLVFTTFAQWDSVWFIHIADHGYDSTQITAFFPLYPIVVHGVAVVLRSTVVAGVVVSLASALTAAVILVRLARVPLGDRVARDAVIYLALYPLAFVFTAVYSDGLFLALAAGSMLAAQRQRGWLAGVLGTLAVGTRLIGLALIPALLVLLWPRERSLRHTVRPLAVAIVPVSLIAYMIYLQDRFGDALAFSRAQTAFWNRHVSSAGPFGGLWDATLDAKRGALELLRHLPRSQGYPTGIAKHDMWASWNVVQFVLLVLALWLTLEAWRRVGPAFGLYSLATITIFLSSRADLVPLVSVPRFLIADFPLFFALASLTANRPRVRESLLVAFAAFGAAAAVAFAHGAWVA